MAGSATTELQVLVKTPGVEKLPQLSNSLRRLTVSTKEAGLSFTKLSAGLKKQQAEGGKSINNTRALSNAWKELAASVEFGSKQFEVATARAKRLDASLMKMQGATKGAGGLSRMARTFGAIAGAGVFGGPEGALGAGIGGLASGFNPLSAAVGGAIGAQVGMVRQSLASTATYAADIKKQRMALKLVVADNDRYAKSMEFITKTSKELAIPQEVITRQFTQLSASVLGAGGSMDDAETSFLAVASGIRGTGGTIQDMNAALTATSQVWSKGKVSAEELRQQLGERLPGAFTIFAKSLEMTPAELDKALEQGKVTLSDFLSFSEALIEKYGDKAVMIAQSTFAAGDRMQTALSKLKESMGTLIQPIGAQIQDFLTVGIEKLDKAVRGVLENMPKLISLTKILAKVSAVYIAGWVALSTGKAITAIVDTFKMLRKIDLQRLAIEKAIAALKVGASMKNPWAALAAGGAAFALLNKAIDYAMKGTEKLFDNIDLIGDITTELNNKTNDLGQKGVTVYEGLTAGVKEYFNGIKSLGEEIGDAVGNAFKGMEDAIVSFVMTGKASFKDFARSILADMARIYARQLMLKIFDSFTGGASLAADRTLSGLGSGSALNTTGNLPKGANGLVVAKNGIVPFAQGGVVSQPTIFPYAKGGIGLMGEAGPEAIMPLKRGSDGRLGVEAKYRGGGGTTVNYTGPTLNFNGDEYVPRSAVGEIINAAAQRGASVGEARTLSSLRNSRSRRSNLGL